MLRVDHRPVCSATHFGRLTRVQGIYLNTLLPSAAATSDASRRD